MDQLFLMGLLFLSEIVIGKFYRDFRIRILESEHSEVTEHVDVGK